MIRTHFKLASRNLVKNKVFSFINVLGLSVAMTACILILLFVKYELSYDDFHQDAQRIYRVSTRVTLQNQLITHETSTYDGIYRSLKDEFPAIDAVTTIGSFNPGNTFVRVEDENHNLQPVEEYEGIATDTSFFDVFSFELLSGDKNSVLRSPFTAVVSETMARQYFNSNAVGKILETDDGEKRQRYTITGIVRDVPGNSHFKFDILISSPADETNFWNGSTAFWDWTGKVYILAQEGTDISSLENELNTLALKKNELKINKDDYGQTSTFHLQALNDIHLHSHLSGELQVNGSSLLVYALIALVIIIIVIAWINYINLSTSIATEKVREIGIRKVVGASRSSLLSQVLTESALFNFISILISFMLVHLLFIPFSNFTGMPITYSNLPDKWAGLFLIFFFIISTLMAGVYPARVIASFNTLSSLKGRSANASLSLRKGLVVFQFTAAIVLMITTVIAFRQLTFMLDKELGISIDEIVVVKAQNFDKETWSDSAGGYVVDSAYTSKAAQFRNDLLNHSSIVNVTALSHLPGQLPNWGTEFQAKDNPEKAVSLKALGIDYDFLNTFKVKLLAGRNFSTDFPSDQGNEGKRAVILNEAAANLLGFKTPQEAVHLHINTYWHADYEVIGVINSFHQLSVKENLTPIYFILQPRALSYLAINFKGNDVPQVVKEVRRSWNKFFPDYPFNSFFLNEYFERQYQHDQKLSGLLSFFSGLAIVIACMGLFGLTSYAIVQRTKEIGIRKVLGATLLNVVGLFTRDFVKLILIANAIAIPLVYLVASRWLENYASRISLGWWIFILPFILILGIAILTVSLQAIRIAVKNPVDSLKSE